MNTALHSRVSPVVLSSMLIALSALWFISACVFHVANRTSKDSIFAAPVWALLSLTLVPLSTCLLVPWLLRARRREGKHLQAIDCFALVAAVVSFAGGVWALVIH